MEGQAAVDVNGGIGLGTEDDKVRILSNLHSLARDKRA
jgi:hypothetical protein